MVEEWRLVQLEYENPYLNMALEEAIPTIVGEDLAPETVRFWRNKNSVVIGRFQCVELEIDPKACQKYQVSVVRRFTGGGAVYHDLGNLNLSISLRKNNRLLSEDILENLKILSQGVVKGLRRMGINPEFGQKNTVQINGKKISGVAGSSSCQIFFEHGTLLVNTNLRILHEVLNMSSSEVNDKKGVTSTRSTVTSLKNELSKKVPLSYLKRALIQGFEESFSIRLVPKNLTSNEKELAKELYETKYSRNDWNLQS
jgi:lipoate-protein ligase A